MKISHKVLAWVLGVTLVESLGHEVLSFGVIGVFSAATAMTREFTKGDMLARNFFSRLAEFSGQ
jgi:hypothetical protein